MASTNTNPEGMQGDATSLTPDRIMQIGLGFPWRPKCSLSATELGVFTRLAGNPTDGETLAGQIGLQSRGARDFLDTLVALGFLDRNGKVYSNTPETDFFLDRAKPTYVGGLLRNGERAALPVLGIPDRRFANRIAAE